MAIAAHDFAWHAPSPLWDRLLEPGGGARPLGFKQPALLRFASDDFMGELSRALAAAPASLADYLARAETWRDPGAGWPNGAGGSGAGLKLYQPSQGRFYLVASNLVCRRSGLPDREVDAAAEESAAFVVRRLAPKPAGGAVDPADRETFDEEGWLGDRQSGAWVRLAVAEEAAAGEERLPLFPVFFRQEGRRRRLLAGLVPVAGAEVYDRQPSSAGPGELAADPLGDPRFAEFEAGVAAGIRQVADPRDLDGRFESFLFVLLDWTELLKRHLEPVWDALVDGSGAALGSGAARDLYDLLDRDLTPAVSASWRELLVDVAANASILIAGGDPDDVVDATLDDGDIILAASFILNESVEPRLRGRTRAALAELPAAQAAAPGGAVAPGGAAATVSRPDAYYVLRCVYERPRCSHLHSPTVSEPSVPFKLAPFFDPDAPARPIRVPLPADTSIAGLRRFTKKGVSFLLSNTLRKQMGRVDGVGLGALDDGDLGEPGDDGGSGLGMICSFSIPIITICAFLLLIIIVSLLNIVFFWLPLFRICLPFKK